MAKHEISFFQNRKKAEENDCANAECTAWTSSPSWSHFWIRFDEGNESAIFHFDKKVDVEKFRDELNKICPPPGQKDVGPLLDLIDEILDDSIHDGAKLTPECVKRLIIEMDKVRGGSNG